MPNDKSVDSNVIKVALDIDFLTWQYLMQGGVVGISRAIISLTQALERRPNLDITLSGFCGFDPFLSSYLTVACGQSASQTHLPVWRTIESRFGLQKLHDRLLPLYAAGLQKEAGGKGKQNLAVRGAVKFLKMFDVRHTGVAANTDLFFSTFSTLPDRAVTRNLPRILWVYDLINIRHPEWVTPMQTEIQKKTIASLDLQYDWVVCNAEYVRRDICDYTGLPPERVWIVPLAASDSFKPELNPAIIDAVKVRCQIPVGDYLLALAAFQPRKNIQATIKAFVQLILEHPELSVSLVLAGRLGQIKDEVEGLLLAIAKPFRDRIILTGYVEDADLSALYSGARAFVFPSLAEGFGLPPLEAMRCGTPVIVSNTTSLPEVVGEAGLLVSPTDTNALCQAMYELLTNDVLHQRLRREGQIRAENYTWDHCAERLEALFRMVVSTPL